MPDKNLTDNEIVKALEESISFDEPYESDFTLIRIEYIKNALALINRQKAQIEALRKEKNKLMDAQMFLAKTSDEQQAEIEKLQEAIDEQDIEIAQLYKRIDKAKAEARKEFAERLLSCYEGFDETNEVILFENLVKAIEDTKKEMESDNNA